MSMTAGDKPTGTAIVKAVKKSAEPPTSKQVHDMVKSPKWEVTICRLGELFSQGRLVYKFDKESNLRWFLPTAQDP